MQISEIVGLSTRVVNSLRNDEVWSLDDLLEKTEQELLRTPNLGRKSVSEIVACLASMGLKLGMKDPGNFLTVSG